MAFDTQEAVWYVSRNGEQFGPVPDGEFREMHRANRIEPTDYVWSAELGDWKLAADVLPPAPAGPPPFTPPQAKSALPGHGAAGMARTDRAMASHGGQQGSGGAYDGAPRQRDERVQQTVVEGGSFKFSTFVLLVLGLLVPLWPVSLPLFWFLAYRSYKKPSVQTVRLITSTH